MATSNFNSRPEWIRSNKFDSGLGSVLENIILSLEPQGDIISEQLESSCAVSYPCGPSSGNSLGYGVWKVVKFIGFILLLFVGICSVFGPAIGIAIRGVFSKTSSCGQLCQEEAQTEYYEKKNNEALQEVERMRDDYLRDGL